MRRRKKVQKRQDFYLRPSLEVFRRCIGGRGSRFFAPFAAEFGPRFWSSSTLYGYCAPIRRNNVQRVEGENGLLRRRKNRILPRATRRPGAIDSPPTSECKNNRRFFDSLRCASVSQDDRF